MERSEKKVERAGSYYTLLLRVDMMLKKKHQTRETLNVTHMDSSSGSTIYIELLNGIASNGCLKTCLSFNPPLKQMAHGICCTLNRRMATLPQLKAEGSHTVCD